MFRLFCLMALFLVFSACGDERPCEKDDDCLTRTYCNLFRKRCEQGCRYHVDCDLGSGCFNNYCTPIQEDKDRDGYPPPLDCDDNNPLIHPGADEICGNNIDDNCNGQIDEPGCLVVECAAGERRPCYDGQEKTLTFPGTQCKKGEQICTARGVWGNCQGQILPAPEICDGKDNDCDGQVDNDEQGAALSRPCYSGNQQTAGVGACKEGREICQNQTWSACQGEILPSTEICDGIDNDCDGQIDNVQGSGVACETTLPGVCKAGLMSCDPQSGKLACRPRTPSSAEICGDNLDNDCDGEIDNGCPFQPFLFAQTPSYPHHLALSQGWLALSTRDAKKLLLYERLGTTSPTLRHTVDLDHTPSGIALDDEYAYLQLPQGIEKISLQDGTKTPLVSLPYADHSGMLLLQQGRLYGRFRGQDAQNQPVRGLCRVDIATAQILCNPLPSATSELGEGMGISGIYLLIPSENGLLWVDSLLMQETPSRTIQLPAGASHAAVDNESTRGIVTNPKNRETAILDLNQRQILTTLTLSDQAGGDGAPAPIVTYEGIAAIGHRDGALISFVDLRMRQLMRQVKIGLGVVDLALSAPDAQGRREIWAACAAENTLWRISIPPPAPNP